jgi:transcriptional regulator with XRE-family HTH domain
MIHPCDQIRKIRANLGISQEYIANKLEISQTAYSKIENQQTKIKYDMLFTISQILEVPLIELFDSEYKKTKDSDFIKIQNEETILELKKMINFQLMLIDFIIKKGP